MGGITGPLFGGYVCHATNFRTTNDIQGFLLIGVALLQLIVVYIPMKIKDCRESKESKRNNLKGKKQGNEENTDNPTEELLIETSA